VKIVDDNYEHAKRLLAVWRVLVGVWAPKRWDLSLAALTPYTTPYTPPRSQWIGQPRAEGDALEPPTPVDAATTRRKRRPLASRKLIRHVLRARSNASRLLAEFFAELERSGKEVKASSHLAEAYGGRTMGSGLQPTDEGVQTSPEPQGWRDAREVVRFLRERGAKIGELRHRIGGDWAAASSDGEGEGVETEGDAEDDVVWVPSHLTPT